MAISKAVTSFEFGEAIIEQYTHQLMGLAKRRATKIRPKAIGGEMFGRFSKFYN